MNTKTLHGKEMASCTKSTEVAFLGLIFYSSSHSYHAHSVGREYPGAKRRQGVRTPVDACQRVASMFSVKNSVLGTFCVSGAIYPRDTIYNTIELAAPHLGGHCFRELLHHDAPLPVGLHDYGHKGGREL